MLITGLPVLIILCWFSAPNGRGKKGMNKSKTRRPPEMFKMQAKAVKCGNIFGFRNTILMN
jgi:hypothetical protein